MYLKSIEVQGFKSFANKMTLQFHKGITGIVGPNGSGKSNVADAVRWVLGEQSAKQLRGAKMEDVIFSGTESRKPLGFAYVAITLDNSDHKLAIDYDEVTVARRVYRSGESEYLINGSICRLKDVQELFFDTGIGKEGYSIIGQGQIDKILSGKPEERRELFDEAAGIVKFKKRKQTAEKNLEIEKQNLSRVNDILAELEKQVGPLKNQADTARAYLKMREEQKVLEVNLFLTEFGRIKEMQKELDEKLAIVNGDLSQTKEAFEQTKNEYEQLEQQIEACDRQIGAKHQLCSETNLRREKLEGELRLVTEQINTICQSVENSEKRIEDIKLSIGAKADECRAYEKNLEAIQREIHALDVQQNSVGGRLDAMTDAIRKLKDEIDGRNGDIIEYLNEAAGVRQKISRYDTMLEQINIRKVELNQRLIVLQSEEASNAETVSAYETELKQVLEKLQQHNETMKANNARNETVSSKLNEIRQMVGVHQQEYHGVNSRYSALKNISERYEGYGSSIRRIMEQKKHCPGIVGVVADIIKVEKNYETAVEIALGASIQNVVTEDEQTAKQMIAYLKQNRFGRATFLPLTSITAKGTPIGAGVLREPGVIGLASTLVHTESRYHQLMTYLLGRIVVVEQIDQALALARKYKYSLRIVTLDGESLNPGGSLSGGAYKNASNLLGRGRELEELSHKIQSLRKEIDRLNELQTRLQDERTDIRRRLEEGTRVGQELSLNENTVRMTLNQARAAKTASAQAYEELSVENAQLMQQIKDIDESKGRLDIQLKQIEEKRQETQNLIGELNRQLEQLSDEERRFSEENSGIRLKYSELNQKKAFSQENIRRVHKDIDAYNEEIAGIRQDMTHNEDQLSQRRQASEEYKTQMEQVEVQAAQAQEEWRLLNERRAQIGQGHKEFFTRREALADRINGLDKEQFRLNQQKEKLDEQKSVQSDYMWQEYELTFSGACAFKDDELVGLGTAGLKKAVADQKGAMKALGTVNVNAIEEY
ncbi:MAG: chromosome segregation protein SMC, partial [Catenibacillus sp.]